MNTCFRQPYREETLSSYLSAWRGHFSVKRQVMLDAIGNTNPGTAISLIEDPDFPTAAGWAEAVAAVTKIPREVLEELARPRAFGYLHPAARTSACAGCLAEAQSIGLQYRRHYWALSTVTVCWTHEMPLVEVPAVGWEWAELQRSHRVNRLRHMLDPEGRARSAKNRWMSMGEGIRRDVRLANQCADFLTASDAEVVVWQDLLALLCASWQSVSAPSLATIGVPMRVFGRRGVERLGGHNRPVLLEPPTFDNFCAMSDPAERRACVLMAWQALRLSRLGDQWNAARWQKIVEDMPESAWAWLRTRMMHWPAGFSEYAWAWGDLRRGCKR